ncbi:MAG: hypothetical protein ACYC1D_00075 [Acidimicrobiales bacterium]
MFFLVPKVAVFLIAVFALFLWLRAHRGTPRRRGRFGGRFRR